MKTSEKNLRERKSKKLDSKAKGTLELLLIVGIILIIPLFFVVRSQASPQSLDVTPTAMMEWATTTPAGAGGGLEVTPSAPQLTEEPLTAQGVQPPACTFPLAQTTIEEATPEEYTFSLPQVVLTNGDNDAAISIVEWLPDSRRVLIMREFRDNTQQNIELFTPNTGDEKVYATREHIAQLPVWQPNLNAVVYPAMNIIRVNELTHTVEFARQVLISQGEPSKNLLLADNLSDFSIGIDSRNGQVVYLADKRVLVNSMKQNELLKISNTIGFDPYKWDYRYRGDNKLPISFNMAWRPRSSQIFFYSDGNTNGGYTFLLDTNTGSVCELNFSGWAGIGRWSSDGRYLAISRATERYPINFSDLAVLDTITGQLHTMQIAPQELQGRHYTEDLFWAPDNIHLVAIGSVLPFPPTGRLYDKDKFSGLFLVDFIAGQAIHLIPEYKFFTSWPGINLAWSPDGSNILIRCPSNDHSQLCLVKVQRVGE